jgi:hypothetical protein
LIRTFRGEMEERIDSYKAKNPEMKVRKMVSYEPRGKH